MRTSNVRFVSTFACSGLAAVAFTGPVAAQPPERDASGAWVLGFAGQVDEQSSDSVLATVNWGVTPTTWLSFSAGRSSSPADRADVEADTLVASIDHRFDKVGFTLELEHWGDPDALETEDLRGSVYFDRARWRVDLAYATRDLEIPFTLTGPLGNTLRRTAETSSDSVGVDVRVNLNELWRLYLGVTEYDYESRRALQIIPRIDRLNLLSTSTLTLANSLIDHERSIGIERDIRRMVFNLRFATDESAIDGSSFETTDVALLVPAGARMDIEVNVGRGRSELAEAGWYAGVLLLIYGR
jgi:hypothetical protein